MAQLSDALPPLKNDTLRGTAGFFRVAQTLDGKWTLITPDDRPFFACAVNGVAAVEGAPVGPIAQLQTWRFDTLGARTANGLKEEGLPFVATADFCAGASAIRAAGVRLPDVFDPTWNTRTMQRAEEVCAPLAERRELLGWLADDALGWGRPAGEACPSLLQVCLSLEPSFAAYHAAWEFVLAPHGARLANLAKAWAFPMANKEVVREQTRVEQGLVSRGYLRDNARWTREFAQRYFATTTAAVRAQDPHHLVLGAAEEGSSAGGAATSPESIALWECARASADLPWLRWSDLAGTTIGPVFIGDFTWVSGAFIHAAAGGRRSRLTSVERMLRRGRLALQRLAAHPAVVGYAWAQWCDGAGEQPPFAGGLLHANGAAAREHTELVADINGRIASLRGRSTPSFAP